MPANEFEFRYGDTVVYTGMKTPETMPLSFTPYPEKEIFSFEQVMDILSNPKRRAARKRWGPEKLIDQGRSSACNAYMAAAMWMRSNYLATGKWVDVSPEFLYMNINGGVDNGSMLDDGMVYMTDYGICRRDINGQDLIPKGTVKKSSIPMEHLRFATQDAMNQRAGECYKMPNRSADQCWAALISCLAGRGMVGLAVQVGDRYMRSGKIAGFDRGNGNHAICGDDIIPLTDNPRGFEDLGINSPQSWGRNFADGGYTIIKIEHIAQPCKVHALYGLRSTLTNPLAVSETRIRN